MKDVDIRHVLRNRLNEAYGCDPTTVIVEELGLCSGAVRVDLAVVNGTLKGYEIKSDRDTLARLKSQAETYSRVFDTVTVVVAERHVRSAETVVPPWWGIEAATMGSNALVQLATIRREQTNSHVDPLAVVQLLWRDEVLNLLNRIKPRSAPLNGKPRRILWDALATAVPLDQLKEMVRTCLRSRTQWRADSQRETNGGMSRPYAMSSDYLYRPVRTRKYTHRPS